MLLEQNKAQLNADFFVQLLDKVHNDDVLEDDRKVQELVEQLREENPCTTIDWLMTI